MRRRGFLASGAAVAATAVAGCPYRDEETIPSLSSDWPRPRYDERGTGYREDRAPVSEGDPSVRWSAPMDADDSDRPEPVVVDDVVYVNTRSEVVAFDAADGERRWRRRIADEPSVKGYARGPLTVAEGRLFAGSHGGLFALDTDGTVVWSVEGDGEFPAGSVSGSPVVADGTVFFAVGDTGYAYTVDGEELWARDLGSFAFSAPAFAAPAAGDEAVYFGGNGGDLHRIRPDGTREWTSPVATSVYPLAVAPGVADAVVEVDAETGERRNALPIGSTDAALAVTAEGFKNYVYASGGAGNAVFKMSTDSFAVQGARTFDSRGTGVTAVGSTLYLTHKNGLWVGPRLEDDPAWTVETGDALRGGVAVTDEAVFATSRDTLYGIA
jgi:outer membrane protein assembly factor BamB